MAHAVMENADPATDTGPTQDGMSSAEEEQVFSQLEMRLMLIAGAATGFLIGIFFLIYIVIAIGMGEGHGFAPGF